MYQIRLHGPWSLDVQGLASGVRFQVPGQVWPLASNGLTESGNIVTLTAARSFNRPSGLTATQALHLAVWANQNLFAAFFNEVECFNEAECELRGRELQSLFRSPKFPEQSFLSGMNGIAAEQMSFNCISLSQEVLRAYNSVNLVFRIAATDPLSLGQVVLGIQDRAKS